MQESTLVLLFNGNPPDKLLLGYKKVGLGQGKFTGFGGKVEKSDSILETARREMAEETGIVLQSRYFNYAATLSFYFPNKLEWSQRVHVFTVYQNGEKPQESREMIPKWFPIKSIPYDQMWDDGRYWLPYILAGKSFTADFTYDSDNATVKSVEYTWIETTDGNSLIKIIPGDME